MHLYHSKKPLFIKQSISNKHRLNLEDKKYLLNPLKI